MAGLLEALQHLAQAAVEEPAGRFAASLVAVSLALALLLQGADYWRLRRESSALDAIVGDGASDALLVVPSPAGEPFTQALARELAAEEHLVFACGRYEGIDQRVVDHYAQRMRVRLISLGDYVLNGGEVAVMAMIEAAGRLVPGVVGNPESLVEESHEDGLLEYPSYTKPASWRGLDVPPVLLSGNHGAIAAWRRDQQVERTRRVRPELLDD